MKKWILFIAYLIVLNSCNTQTVNENNIERPINNSFNKDLLKILKKRDFIIDDIDFIIALPEINYLTTSDSSISKNWKIYKNNYLNNLKIHKEIKIFSYYNNSYIQKSQYNNLHFSNLDKVNTSNIENIEYVFFKSPKEEIVGIDGYNFLLLSFYLKDTFFEIVEKDKRLLDIYNTMIANDKFIMFLVLFDTDLADVTGFKERKVAFLIDHFRDCKSIYGKKLYEDFKSIDPNKDF